MNGTRRSNMEDEFEGRRLSQTDPFGLRTLKVFRTPQLVHADAFDMEDERRGNRALLRNDSDESTHSNQSDTSSSSVKSPRTFKKNPRASSQRSSRYSRRSNVSSSRGSVSFSKSLTIISEDQSANGDVFDDGGHDENDNKPPVRRSLMNGVVDGADSSENTEDTDSDDEYNERLPDVEHVGGNPRRRSRWSVGYLKNEFRKVCIDDLYRRYWVRLQRILLFKLLLTLIVQNICIVILYNIIKSHGFVPKLHINIMITSIIVIQLVAAILIFTRKVYVKGFKYIGVLVWISCTAPLFLSVLPAVKSNSYILPMDNVAAVFYVIFVTHTMLPFSRKVSLLLGITTGTLDLVVTAVLANTSTRVILTQLASNILIYTCSNLTGLYHKHLTDIAHRHTFLDTRNFLEADLKYCRQKEKHNGLRESLLSKVIPSHLINKMMDVIKEKFKKLDENVVRTFALTRKLSVHFRHPSMNVICQKNKEMDSSKPTKKNPPADVNEETDSCEPDNLLVERHDNVSILYADIVSFTPLTSEMNSGELVRALNELFGKFDELAKNNGCTRIKMLGDCYYCVSGLPEKDVDHAKNCVRMGLQMIKVIRDIRATTGVEKLDMRIGVHSGCVYSGVIGVRKWQYDIWSDDVITANHMESGGQAGKVHITKATLDELNNEFEVTPGEGHLRDDYLQKHNIETYFIEEKSLESSAVDTDLDPMASDKLRRQPCLTRRFSMYVETFGAQVPFTSLSDYMLEKHLPPSIEVNRRLERAFQLGDDDEEEGSPNSRTRKSVTATMLDAGRQVFHQFKFGAPHSSDDTNTQSLTKAYGSYGDSFQRKGIHVQPVTLRFPQKEHEIQYLNKRDSTYKFYIFCAFLIFSFMGSVQLLTLVRSVALYVSFVFGLLVYLMLTVLVTGLKFLGKNGDKLLSRDCMRWLSVTSETLITSHLWKCLLCVISSLTMFMVSIVPVLNCHNVRLAETPNYTINPTTDGFSLVLSELEQDLTTNDPTAAVITNISMVHAMGSPMEINDPKHPENNMDDLMPCFFAPYYMFSCIAVMVACSVFLRVNHLLKIGLIFCFLVCFNIMFHLVFRDIFRIYDEHIRFAFLPSGFRGTIQTVMVFLALVVLDRQIERNLRLDFLCRVKIEEEKNEVRKKELYNELLLANMLPQHVVEHFVTKSTRKQRSNDELYHQRCRNACIMFASIPNLMAYFAANGIKGRESLEILNETISAFDHIEMTKRFQKVEKIKIIGSTFMAATGLNVVDDTEEDPEKAAENIELMVNFAWAMMTTLKRMRQLLGEQQLRVGINHGEVIAGVVGAQKPQYDIWGDAVNIASRMESTGVLGKIQVPKATADLLKEKNIPCQDRLKINVKGKGMMNVCLVKDYPKIRPRVSVCSMDPANLIFNDLWSHGR